MAAPSSATSSSARTRPCSSSSGAPPSCSARRRRSTCRPPRWRTRSRSRSSAAGRGAARGGERARADHEQGGPAVHAGLVTRGPPPARRALRRRRRSAPCATTRCTARTRVVSLENTHNGSGGRVWPLDELDAWRSGARARPRRPPRRRAAHERGGRDSACRRRVSARASTPSRSASRRGSAARSAR